MDKKQTLIMLIVILLLVIVDQASKFIVIEHIELREEIVVIDNFFVLGHIKNTGISYGSFSDASPIFFLVVYAIAIGVFFYLSKDIDFQKKKLYSISLTMMIAGGIGNLIDRAMFGEVTDFLILILFRRELFGIFNIADVLLVIGMVIFVIDIVLEDVLKWKKNIE